MPQLDKVSFFSQVTYALIAYFGIYFLMIAYICPAIGRVLKLREAFLTNPDIVRPEAHAVSSNLNSAVEITSVVGPAANLTAKLTLVSKNSGLVRLWLARII